jgi:hypothetical protein
MWPKPKISPQNPILPPYFFPYKAPSIKELQTIVKKRLNNPLQIGRGGIDFEHGNNHHKANGNPEENHPCNAKELYTQERKLTFLQDSVKV